MCGAPPSPAADRSACAWAYIAVPILWAEAVSRSVAWRMPAASSPFSCSFSSATADSTSDFRSPGTLSGLSLSSFSVE